MSQFRALLFALMAFCMCHSLAYSQEVEFNLTTPQSAPVVNYMTFRLNALYANYFSGTVASSTAAWVPTVQHNDGFATRILIGLSLLKDKVLNGPSLILAPEIQVLVAYRFYSAFEIELGGGLQEWLIPGAITLPMLTANLNFKLNGFIGFIDSIFVGYSAVWEILQHDQVRLGFQFEI